MQHVDKFGVYDMDHSGVRLEPRRGGDPDEVELVLALREKGRLFLKLALRSVVGKAEA